jgi:hypothetical protein
VHPSIAATLGENSGSANHIHAIAHPNPALAVMADAIPALASVHAAALRSEPQHLFLNGQSLIRTDPTDDATAHERGVRGSGWHVDNAFLASHTDATPREVYTRSMVTLSAVECGGGAIMFSPGSTAVTRREVQRLVDDQGEAAYHGQQWRWSWSPSSRQSPAMVSSRSVEVWLRKAGTATVWLRTSSRLQSRS